MSGELRKQLAQHLGVEALALKQRQLTLSQVRDKVQAHPQGIDNENFSRVSSESLSALFDEYDRMFLGGYCKQVLQAEKAPLRFRFSRRMVSTGGKTTRLTWNQNTKNPKSEYEIAISATLLFQNFRDSRPVLVTGVPCTNRLDALLRVFEHELIHLAEMLVWRASDCQAHRFQSISRSLFGHRASSHQLLTPSDRAWKEQRVRAGDWVEFSSNDQVLVGRINRITKRATVLVADRKGSKYSDGNRYVKYYVPIDRLRPCLHHKTG